MTMRFSPTAEDLLTNIDASKLFCPFLTTANPSAMIVQRRTLEWLDEMNIEVTGALFDDISEVGWLSALTYPASPLEPLQLAADWTTVFFLLDDLVEQSMSHVSIGERNGHVIAALDDTGSQAADDGVFRAVRDVGRRARALGGDAWMRAFVREVERWLDSHLWEQANRDKDEIPTLADYLEMRQFTIGMYFEFLLSELTDSYRLTEDERVSSEATTLARIASSQIAWTNDILTLGKELAQGDVHNGVLSLMDSRNLSLEDALARAIDLHNEQIKAFISLSESLRAIRGTSRGMLSLIKGLERWMGGHMVWARGSKRYGASVSATWSVTPTALKMSV